MNKTENYERGTENPPKINDGQHADSHQHEKNQIEEEKRVEKGVNMGVKRRNEDDHESGSPKAKQIRLEPGQSLNESSDLSTHDRDVGKSSDQENPGHAAAVASHYNARDNEGLQLRNQSRIVYMRNFNNWIKSMLINEYLEKAKQGKSYGDPIRVLDMCCGKGGDLLKWRKANVTHVICADIAQVSVEHCQSRYKDMGHKRHPPLFTAEFLAHDCTKVRLREKYKDPSLQLDLVSCQFAFHYSFESLPQAECMFRNASESLRPGGYFIGTMPNANELVARLHKAEGNKFGNDIYSVSFLCDKNNLPLFGAKYDFHLEGVVDCPEFLVHPSTFRKLASKFGLELIMFESFSDFYQRMKDGGKTLLSRMQALETFPPYHEAPLLAENSQEYQHAIEYMQSSTGHRKIGTLSQSEWEATSLYCVFAFKKGRTTWNAQGNPEYVKC